MSLPQTRLKIPNDSLGADLKTRQGTAGERMALAWSDATRIERFGSVKSMIMECKAVLN